MTFQVSLSWRWELPAATQICRNKASGRLPGALSAWMRPALSYLLIMTISCHRNVRPVEQQTSAEQKVTNTFISDRLFTATRVFKSIFPVLPPINAIFSFLSSTSLTVPKWMINFFTYALFLQGLELFMRAARCEGRSHKS